MRRPSKESADELQPARGAPALPAGGLRTAPRRLPRSRTRAKATAQTWDSSAVSRDIGCARPSQRAARPARRPGRTRREWQVAEMSGVRGRGGRRDRTARRARADNTSFLACGPAFLGRQRPDDLGHTARRLGRISGDCPDGPALRSGRQTALAGAAPGFAVGVRQRIPRR